MKVITCRIIAQCLDGVGYEIEESIISASNPPRDMDVAVEMRESYHLRMMVILYAYDFPDGTELTIKTARTEYLYQKVVDYFENTHTFKL